MLAFALHIYSFSCLYALNFIAIAVYISILLQFHREMLSCKFKLLFQFKINFKKSKVIRKQKKGNRKKCAYIFVASNVLDILTCVIRDVPPFLWLRSLLSCANFKRHIFHHVA